MSQDRLRLTNYLPYLLSRGALAAMVCWSLGPTVAGVATFLSLCALSVLYLKSGWFRVHPEKPWAPLCRDEHGQWAQYQALRWAVVIGCLAWVVFEAVLPGISLGTSAGQAGFQIGLLSYFGVQAFYLQFA